MKRKLEEELEHQQQQVHEPAESYITESTIEQKKKANTLDPWSTTPQTPFCGPGVRPGLPVYFGWTNDEYLQVLRRQADAHDILRTYCYGSAQLDMNAAVVDAVRALIPDGADAKPDDSKEKGRVINE